MRAAIRAPVPRSFTCRPIVPDLNPIEKFFAKLKALLRKAATRSLDALWDAVGDLRLVSNQPNAPTKSKTQAMVRPNRNPL